MLNSFYRELVPVSLPYQGRQKYMHSFNLADPVMPDGYDDYRAIVTDLCAAAGANSGIAHMTVDEKIVPAGMSQRRPGPHVDGCFMPSLMDWSHGPGPGWLHNCNVIGTKAIKRMPIITAASVSGCRVWSGQFDGIPSDRGDLSHIADQLGNGTILAANVGYMLSADCVHESMIFPNPTKRTFLRIALPTEYAQ